MAIAVSNIVRIAMRSQIVRSLTMALFLSCCTLAAQDHLPGEEKNDRTNLGLQGPVHSSLIVTAQVNADPRDSRERHLYYFKRNPVAGV